MLLQVTTPLPFHKRGGGGNLKICCVLDIKFSKKPILVLSDKFKQSLSNTINFYRNKSNTNLSRYLENANCEGLIVRPDRFILASIKNLKDVKLITKRNLKLLI